MRKVKFTLSIGFPGAKHEETISLDDLGIDPQDFDEKELEEALNESLQEWLIAILKLIGN